MIHLDEKVGGGTLEKAVLVGIYNRENPKEKVEENLNELALLTETAGGTTYKTWLVKMDRPNSGTYVGTGKLDEIRLFVEEHKIDLIVFDDDLTPSQVRNIDKALNIKVLDRSGIILHIFSQRARTAQAMAQVELAQLQYMLPRLTGLWTHLSKQRGGIGLKGAGEKEIETDRRIIRNKIALLKEKLKVIDRQNQTRRKGRGEMIRVALVGYTNVGKSTIMNVITKSDVLAEDKLFATLDTTVRKVVLDGTPFLLSDTVGFIRKLPHDLVECFKSTLDEARESDILIHVVDVSHPTFEEQILVVNQTLAELGIAEKPTILVFNKIDRITAEERERVETAWFAKEKEQVVFLSAAKRQQVDIFRATVVKLVRELYHGKYPHGYNPDVTFGAGWE